MAWDLTGGLQSRKEPVGIKVAAVEVLKAMMADDDESTADAIKVAVERHPEVSDR